MFNYLVVFLAVLYAAYTDFTKREVNNWLTFGLIAFGLIYHLIVSIVTSNYYLILYVFLFSVLVFCISYLLWKLGIFAGGDAKLYTGIAASIPYSTFSVFGSYPSSYTFVLSLFVLTLFVVFPYGALIGLLEIIKRKDLLEYIYKEFVVKSFSILESALIIVCLYLVLSFFKLPTILILPLSIISGFIPKILKIPFIVVLFPIAMYIDFVNNLKIIIVLILISYFIWFIFKLFFLTRSGLLNYFVYAKDLKEGDLLAHPLMKNDDGKLVPYTGKMFKDLLAVLKKPNKVEYERIMKEHKEAKANIVVDNSLAAGLSKENILYIRKNIYKDEKIELKKTTALVPAVFIAYCVMLVFGDVIWYLLKI